MTVPYHDKNFIYTTTGSNPITTDERVILTNYDKIMQIIEKLKADKTSTTINNLKEALKISSSNINGKKIKSINAKYFEILSGKIGKAIGNIEEPHKSMIDSNGNEFMSEFCNIVYSCDYSSRYL